MTFEGNLEVFLEKTFAQRFVVRLAAAEPAGCQAQGRDPHLRVGWSSTTLARRSATSWIRKSPTLDDPDLPQHLLS